MVDVRGGYYLNTHARTSLERSGLLARIRALEQMPDIPRGHSISEWREPIYIALKGVEDSYLRGQYAGDGRMLRTRMNTFFRENAIADWRLLMNRDTQAHDSLPTTAEDLLVISGALATYVLEPSDFAAHQSYGFTKPLPFLATVGASVYNEMRNRQGHRTVHTGRIPASSICPLGFAVPVSPIRQA